jgi:hypothetical protein
MRGRFSGLLTCTLGVILLGSVLGYTLTVMTDSNILVPDVSTEGPVDTEPVLDDTVTPGDDLAGRYHLRKRTSRFFKRVRVV